MSDKVTAIMQEVSDTPPWAYTYRERPADLLEIRAEELQAILEAHVRPLEVALTAIYLTRSNSPDLAPWRMAEKALGRDCQSRDRTS